MSRLILIAELISPYSGTNYTYNNLATIDIYIDVSNKTLGKIMRPLSLSILEKPEDNMEKANHIKNEHMLNASIFPNLNDTPMWILSSFITNIMNEGGSKKWWQN